ncbi:hypothetical protein Tco_1255482, partial [Tanacetum coccineum]
MRNPARSASYSASLLVVSNSNLNAYIYSFPSRLTTIRPAPEPSELEASSVNSFHAFFGSFLLTSSFFASLFFVSGVSARKSANICPLIEFLPLNSISCSPNSMAHLAMRPDFSGFARIYFMGLSLRTSPCNVRVTKYTGICFFPLSAISTALTFSSEVARSLLLSILLPGWIALFLSGARLLFFCYTGSAWVEVHAKTSMYLFKRSRSLIFILVGSCLPI